MGSIARIVKKRSYRTQLTQNRSAYKEKNMSVINCRCGKPLKSGMEVEHSAWLNEFFCSPSCAQDRYFEYMESTPVDFENKLPDGASINDDGFLVDDTEQDAHLTPESLATSQVVSNASAVSQSDGDTSPAQAQVA